MVRIQLHIGEWATASGAKVTSRLFAAVERTNAFLLSAREALIDLGHRAKAGHLRLQQALREKENHLAKLLADSADPMVVTDSERRFVAANSAALALFNVSRKNIRNFTIDAFLTPSEIHCFEHKGPPFVKGAVQAGECAIKCLGGQAKVVNFTFRRNFMLGRDLIEFQRADSSGGKKAVEQQW
jgi:PAS domain-containing protein